MCLGKCAIMKDNNTELLTNLLEIINNFEYNCELGGLTYSKEFKSLIIKLLNNPDHNIRIEAYRILKILDIKELIKILPDVIENEQNLIVKSCFVGILESAINKDS